MPGTELPAVAPISPAAINYILLGFVLFFLVISAIIGFRRGFKKSLFRFLWVALSTVALFFITPALSGYLNGMDLSGYGLNIFGEVRKISDIGVNLMSNFGLSEYMSNSPALVQFAENVSIAVLNVVLLVLLFWLTKWILGIPYLLISKKLFDKKSREEKAYKKKVKKLQQKGSVINETVDETPIILPVANKNRGLGLLFGVLLGMIICALTLFPVVGLNSLYQKVYASVTFTDETEEEVPYLSTVIDDEIASYINSYEDSFASKIMTYSGMAFLSDFLFDSMTTVQVNNQNISIVNEVSVGVKVYQSAMEIKDFAENIDDATENSIAKTLVKVKEVFSFLEDSTALSVFGDDLLPYFIEKEFINKPSVSLTFGGEDYADMLREAYNNYKLTNTVNVASIKEQVEAVVDIAVLLNNNHLVYPLLKNEINDFNSALSLVAENIGIASNFSQNLVNNLFMISMIEYKYPEFIDDLLHSAFEEALISGFETNAANISSSNLKNALKKLLENTINLMKNIHSSVDFDFGTQAKNTAALVQLGKIMDSAKNDFLSTNSYNQLIDFVQTKANEQSADFADLTDFTAKISDIASWEAELQSLAPLYTVVIKIVNENKKINGEEYAQTFDYEKVLETDFEQLYDIGSALQTVLNGNVSKTVTSENIKNLFSAMLDELITNENLKKYLDEVKVDGVSLREVMLTNIWDGTSTQITHWGNELKYSLEVVRKILLTFADFDKDAVALESNDELKEFGRSIDDALSNTKLFLSSSAMRSFMEYFLDQTEFPEEFENILTNPNYYSSIGSSPTVKSAMLNNIWNGSTTQISSWETEFAILKNLFGATFSGTGSEKYVSIGTTLDSLAHSKILDRDIVKRIIIYYIDEETEDLDALLTGVNGPVESIKEIITIDEKDSLGEYQIKYGEEIPYLIELVDIVQKNYSGLGGDTARFEAIGSQFDLLIFNGSKLLTKAVINKFVAHYIDDAAFTVPDEYIDVKTEIFGTDNANLNLIESYSLEFSVLLDATDLMTDASPTLTDIGVKLDEIMLRNSVLVTRKVINQLLSTFIDENSTFTIPSQYEEIKETIFGTKNNETKIYSKFTNDMVYKNELGTLKKAIDFMDELPNDLTGEDSISAKLDDLLDENSTLFDKYTISSMIEVFFDDSVNIDIAQEGETAEADAILIALKTNVSNPEKITTGRTYSHLFEEVEEIQEKLTSIKNVDSLGFQTVGTVLDEINLMELAGGENVAQSVHDLLLNRLKNGFMSDNAAEIDNLITNFIPTNTNTYYSELYSEILNLE